MIIQALKKILETHLQKNPKPDTSPCKEKNVCRVCEAYSFIVTNLHLLKLIYSLRKVGCQHQANCPGY